jgi:hypothetical protein
LLKVLEHEYQRSLSGFTGSAHGPAGALLTTAVGAEEPVADPAEFVAVTVTRNDDPASARTTMYVDAVASEIGAHEAPAESQRCQRYV